MRHHTKDKGDIGLLKASAELSQQGYTVLFPVTEHADFDLVAYKQRRFLRIQVKYRTMRSNGTVAVPFKSSWSDSKGLHEKSLNKEEIDLICLYCPNVDECYFFDPSDYRKSIQLRIMPARNKQKRGVHNAQLFRKVP